MLADLSALQGWAVWQEGQRQGPLVNTIHGGKGGHMPCPGNHGQLRWQLCLLHFEKVQVKNDL